LMRRWWELGLLLVAVVLTTSGSLPLAASAAVGPSGAAEGAWALGPGAVAAGPAAAAAPQGLRPVRVGMQYIVSDAPVLIADEWGYFREAGLELQPERIGTPEMQARLATGQLDGAAIGPTASVLNAFLRGIRLKVVADRGTLAPGHGYLAMVVRRDLIDSGQVRTIADLRGRKIGAQPPLYGEASYFLLSKILEQGGLTEDDLEYVPVTLADQNAALAGRTIDAGWGGEPNITAAVESGIGVRFVGGDEAYGPVTLGGFSYSEEFAAQTDPARRFMVAFVRGIRTYLDAFTRNQGREAVVALLARQTSLRNPALYERVVMPGMDPNGTFGTHGLQEIQEYYVRHGILPQTVDINQIVDRSFAQWAAEQLGPY